MYKLSLEVLNECNLNCSYCYLGEKKRKRMPVETAIKAVDMALHEAEKQYDKKLLVYFIGGEPLLVFNNISKIVQYVKNKCVEKNIVPVFATTTNGTLLTESIIDMFIEEKFELKVSIDGTREEHDRNRRDYNDHGSYNKIMDRLSLLSKYENLTQKPVAAVHVVTVNNVNQWYENFKHIVSLGFSYINNDFNIYDDWSYDKMQVLKGELEKILKYYFMDLRKQKRVYWKNTEDFIMRTYKENAPFLRCGAGVCSVYVNTDGVYYHCKEIEEEKRIGSILEGLDVGRIREFASLKETENKNCLKCKYLKWCAAKGCVIDNYIHNNNIFEPVEVKCNVTKWVYDFIEKIFGQGKLVRYNEL